MEKVLFPDRGAKVENGRVYQPLAFGSTRPRNMMPGHLATGSDERTLRNLKARHARERKIARLRSEAAKKGAAVYSLMGDLKGKRTDYLAGVQLRKFHDAIKSLKASDEGMRPSDKAGALRDYGLLDRDLWGLSELRGWFNKKAPATPPAASSARFAGGHTLRGPTPKTAPKPMSAKHGPRYTNRFTRPRTAVKLPPAGVVPGKVTQAPAHWIDHENNLRTQTKAAEHLRKSGRLPNKCPKPWKDRPLEDEGFEPPYDHYVKEQKNLWNQPGLAERQKMVKDRVKHMQGGTDNLLHHL